MFILTQILFAISMTSFSLCLYFLFNEIRTVYVLKHHNKLVISTFLISVVTGILSCLVHGNYTFFFLSDERVLLVSDGMTFLIFFIFAMFASIKLLAKIFHWETIPNSDKVDGIRGQVVDIKKEDITIQAEAGPILLTVFDESTNKQIGIWQHDGKTDYIVFTCAVDKSDMIADIYKLKKDDKVYHCDTAIMLSKEKLVIRLLKIGAWFARLTFVAGMLLANYEMYHLPDGMHLSDYNIGYTLNAAAMGYLLEAWVIRHFRQSKSLGSRILCIFGWFAVIITGLIIINAVLDPATWEKLFVVYDTAGNVVHTLR